MTYQQTLILSLVPLNAACRRLQRFGTGLPLN
jgi:hypothetical protein